MFLKERGSLNIKDFVKVISGDKDKPHVLVEYLSAELKIPDYLKLINNNVHISECLMHNCVCVFH